MEFAFFGSAVLWMLVTYPAYWVFQWYVEGEPFHLWRRYPASAATEIQAALSESLAQAGASLSAVADGGLPSADVSLERGATH